MPDESQTVGVSDKDQLNQAITADTKRVLRDAVPERSELIEQIWIKYSPEVRVLSDREGFNLQGGAFGKINIGPRDAILIWLYAFMSCRALYALSGFLFEQIACGRQIDPKSLALRTPEAAAFEGYKNLLQKATGLRFAGSILDSSWPSDIPRPVPTLNRADLSVPDQMGYDLAHFAYAYAILHELRHVMFWKDGDSPAEKKDEEISCDEYAFDLTLGDIPTHADRKNDESGVRRKRAASLMLVMSLPLGVADEDYWSETQSHPSVRQRLEALMTHLGGLPADDCGWLYCAAVLLARLSFAGSGQMQIRAASPQELFEQLVTGL